MVLGHRTGALAAEAAYPRPASPENKLHESLDWHWWLLQLFPQQYYDKDDEIINWRVPFGRPRSIPDDAIIHHTAEHRLRHTADGQDPYRPKNLKLENLNPIHAPISDTTANLTGCFIQKTPDGKASVPEDPLLVRWAKMVFGCVFFVIFWLFLAVILILLVGGCRILVMLGFDLLNKCAGIHWFFTILHRWVIG
jgi:hypothetical protein